MDTVRPVHKRLACMVVLLLVGWAFYITALDYGRPSPEYAPSTFENGWLNGATVYHPDAFAYVGHPYTMMLRGQVRLGYYHNPAVAIYANMLLQRLAGMPDSHYHGLIDPQNLPADLDCDSGQVPDPRCARSVVPFSAHVMGRVISALFMLVAVAGAYKTGRVAVTGSVGLLTAFFVAFVPSIVQHAHYELPSAPTVAFVALSCWFAFWVYQRPQRWYLYVLTGLCIGLATSSRYNAAVIGLLPFVFMAVRWWQGQSKLIFLGLFFVMIPVGFFLGTPAALLELGFFVNDVQFIMEWYRVHGGGAGWDAPDALSGVYHHWRYTVLFVMGPLTSLFALLGLIVAWAVPRLRWPVIASVAFFVILTAMTLVGMRLNANLLLPLIVPLALWAAYGVQRVTQWIRGPFPAWQPAFLAVILAAWPVYLSLSFNQLLATPDTRLEAQQWLFEHVPQGTSVGLLGSYNVPVDPLAYSVTQVYSGMASPEDPIWESAIIIYSDAVAHTVLRDLSLTRTPETLADLHQTLDRLDGEWVELARFARRYWPGQDVPPDDVSYWHQMEITLYCHPVNCPVATPAAD